MPLIGLQGQEHVPEEEPGDLLPEAAGTYGPPLSAPIRASDSDAYLEEMADQMGMSHTHIQRIRSGFNRSQSESQPPGSSVAGGRSSNAEESDDNSSSVHRFGRGLSVKSRRRVTSNRDYTSITDELECLIVAPLPVTPITPPPPPAIKIESETLHDAEETDYNLMESLINRRLRRDSHNLQASLEDLVTKSIRDDESNKSAKIGDDEVMLAPAGDGTVEVTAATEVAVAVGASETEGCGQEGHSGGARAHGSDESRSTKREGAVRIRLGSTDDKVEVEFIDETTAKAGVGHSGKEAKV